MTTRDFQAELSAAKKEYDEKVAHIHRRQEVARIQGLHAGSAPPAGQRLAHEGQRRDQTSRALGVAQRQRERQMREEGRLAAAAAKRRRELKEREEARDAANLERERRDRKRAANLLLDRQAREEARRAADIDHRGRRDREDTASTIAKQHNHKKQGVHGSARKLYALAAEEAVMAAEEAAKTQRIFAAATTEVINARTAMRQAQHALDEADLEARGAEEKVRLGRARLALAEDSATDAHLHSASTSRTVAAYIEARNQECREASYELNRVQEKAITAHREALAKGNIHRQRERSLHRAEEEATRAASAAKAAVQLSHDKSKAAKVAAIQMEAEACKETRIAAPTTRMPDISVPHPPASAPHP